MLRGDAPEGEYTPRATMRHRLALILLSTLACDDSGPQVDAAPPDAGDAGLPDGGGACASDEECDDRDPCTTEVCEAELCVRGRVEPTLTVSRPISIEGEISDVLLRGDRLVVARGELGLEVWDVGGEHARLEFERNPEADEGPARHVLHSEGRLYLLGDGRNVVALDAESTAPISTYASAGDVHDLAFFEHFVVVATGAKGLEVVDYEDPANPRRRARLDTSGRATALARRGDLLLVADGLGGVVHVNMAERTAPVRVGEPLPTEGRVLDVASRGQLAVLAEGAAGFGVVDLSTFTRTATLDLGSDALAVALPSPNTAVVAAGDAGLLFLDVLAPDSPVVWARVELDGRAHALSRDGARYAVAVGTGHAVVVELGCESDAP